MAKLQIEEGCTSAKQNAGRRIVGKDHNFDVHPDPIPILAVRFPRVLCCSSPSSWRGVPCAWESPSVPLRRIGNDKADFCSASVVSSAMPRRGRFVRT